MSSRSIDPLALARNIRRRRLALEWTQAELARAAGLPAPTVNRYENAQRRKEPSVEHLQQIARALRCTLDDLLIDRPASPEPAADAYVTYGALEDLISTRLAETLAQRLVELVPALRTSNQFPTIVPGDKQSQDAYIPPASTLPMAAVLVAYRVTSAADLQAILQEGRMDAAPGATVTVYAPPATLAVPSELVVTPLAIDGDGVASGVTRGDVLYVAVEPDRTPLGDRHWRDGQLVIASVGGHWRLAYLQHPAPRGRWRLAGPNGEHQVLVDEQVSIAGLIVFVGRVPPAQPGRAPSPGAAAD